MKNFKAKLNNTVLFQDLNKRIDFKELTDKQALELYLAHKTAFVELLPTANKKIFAKTSKKVLEVLKSKLTKSELITLEKVLSDS